MNTKILLREQIKKLLLKKEMEFLKALSRKGKVYLVGGAVRDFILKRNTQDFDFLVIDLHPKEIDEILKKFGKNKAIEARSFGVFKFQPKKSKIIFDIAIPRKDHWYGLRYKDLKPQFGVSLKEDLSRRDFTINSLALDFEGNLIDPFGGLNDIKSKKIKAVGNPKERFLEDPSRILRGLRLASELGFEIEEKTKNSMAELKREILRKTKEGKTRVSEEIIAEEFLKGFYSAPKKMIELLNSVGVLKIILPEIAALKGVRQPEEFHTEGDVFEHTLLALQKLEELKKLIKLGRIKSPIPLLPDSIHTKLGLLFHDIGKPKTFKSKSETGDRIRFTGHDAIGAKMTGKICKRLKLSIFPKKDPLHVDIEKLVFLVKNHMICVNKNLEKMKLSTIEKYFFHPDKRGGELLTLSWADISATIPPGGNPDFTLFNKLISKLNEVKNVIFDKQKEKMVPYLLDGNEIMKILNLTPSPKVGKIKQEIRELQLKGRLKTKKEAINWLKKQKI